MTSIELAIDSEGVLIEDAKSYRAQSEKAREAYYKHGFDDENNIFTGINPSDDRQVPNAMALR